MSTVQKPIVVKFDINGNNLVWFSSIYGWTNRLSGEVEVIDINACDELIENLLDLEALPAYNDAGNQDKANEVNATLEHNKVMLIETCKSFARNSEEEVMSAANFVLGSALSINVTFICDSVISYGESKKEDDVMVSAYNSEEEVPTGTTRTMEQGAMRWHMEFHAKSPIFLDEDGEACNSVHCFLGYPKTYGELLELLDGLQLSYVGTSKEEIAEYRQIVTSVKTELSLLVIGNDDSGVNYSEVVIVEPTDGAPKLQVEHSFLTAVLQAEAAEGVSA